MKKLRLTQKRREWLERLADNQVKNPDAYSQIPPVTALVQLETAGYLERNPTAKYPQWRITPAGLAAIASASSAAPEAAQVSRPLGDEPENDLIDEPIPTKPLYTAYENVQLQRTEDGLLTDTYEQWLEKVNHQTAIEFEKLHQENTALQQQFTALVTEIDMLSLSSSSHVQIARQHLLERVKTISPDAQSLMDSLIALRQENAKLLASEQAYHEEVERLRAALQTLVRYVEDNATVLDLPLGLRLRARAARNTLLAAALTEAGE